MEQPPLPLRIAWFAPWKWKRRWLAIWLLLMGYLMSPIPVLWVAERLGTPGTPDMVANTAYLPLSALSNRFAPIAWFYEAQRNLLCDVIGEP